MKSDKQLTPKLAADLENLINNSLDMSFFPYVKGKSVRIKHVIVRETKFGYLVFDTKENKEIAKTFCKTSALALAKNVALDRNRVKEIQELDDIIQKHYNDAMFFKNTIRVTKDQDRKFVAETRYELAAAKTRDAKQRLDRIIYS
jgi:hypothetical protein